MYDDFEDEIDKILNGDLDFLDEDADLEILNEDRVFLSQKPIISFAVDKDAGKRNEYYPYFKIINGPNPNNASKIARISFDDHRYIIHKDNLLHWELSNKDIKIINKILLMNNPKYGCNVYESLIMSAAFSIGINVDDFIVKYHVNTNPDISDIHYNSIQDYNKAKEKGIAK